jgi:dTDP-glucose 4,6-dehydratase
LPIYGDGSNIRDWLYVEDHCRALDLIFHKGRTGECYNIGGSNEWRNLDVVHLICDLLDKELGRSGEASFHQLITFVKDRPGHDQRYAIDPRKMLRELKWSPELDFQTGLLQTIRWYLNNQAWVEQVTSGSYREYYRQQYNV